MREKDRDAYNFYKEELQKNGYISGDSKEWFAWFSECIKEEHLEVTCLDFTDAGMGQYIVMRKSIISKIERMVVQKIAHKQKELDALVNAVKVLRREENR